MRGGFGLFHNLTLERQAAGGATLTEDGSARSLHGLSDFDQPHRMSANYGYTLPWFQKSRGLIGWLLGG